ncbi:DEAD/DEAH box helicase family protein [Tolypothrix sp. FACHB-123]|uniref:helicase-related protein n=1 Tax=Tolypothrix sp. FACHB-123 TaxID=2692868 RepID=UPI0016853EA3|nr:helicase-related protein [Tolypothrix sp. FACHB-123]MBD2358143.1 DEAD/DEAH box helicase family protein [Tolypothrix sp. FACHB-123]
MTNLLPGTEVQARGLRWEVVTSDRLGGQTLYRLRCLEGVLRGQELDLLAPFETIEPIIHSLQPDRAAPLRSWLVYHQAFLLEQALGQNALLAVQPGRLRIEPYQLIPVLRAIRMSRVRLLLADGVGLGKTIQAGLVLTELMARRVAHRILIVCPSGPLLEQWKLEMAERFGLRLDVINRARLEEIRRSTELGANPFDHIPLGLVSIDFLKQERVLELLERASYDVVAIDEAHHCMDLGAAQEREDSQRRRLAEVLAQRCDSLLLLTATPHDGNERSFASLCELLDPSLVDGRGALRGDRYRSYVVRRLKHHIIDPVTKKQRFKERIVNPRPVTATDERHPQFVELQHGLLELIAGELKRAFRAKRYSDVLSFITLLKRSVSTVEACRSTLTVVAERLQQILTQHSESQESRRQRLRTLRDYYRKLERFGTVSLEEEQEQTILEAEELAQQLASLQREVESNSRSLKKVSSVVDILDELVGLAGAAQEQDPKLEQLVAEITDIRVQEPQTNILVYTEYIDSQQAAVKALQAAGVGEVLAMSGEDSDRDRREITHRFCTQTKLILVSTDTAAEGLNLHQRCHHLIHIELPFNPNRLEQRNGRIDRFGQEYPPQVCYLYLRGTFEERILLRLIAKYERQRARLTFVPNTLGLTATTDAAAERLLKGLMDEDQKLFNDSTPLFNFYTADENEGTDTATQELLEEIDRSLKGFEQAARTNSWLGEVGMNAEQRLLAEAAGAREQGTKVGAADLVGFVCDAVNLDGGEVCETDNPEIFEVKLPSAWSYGLDDLPGYDKDKRLLRLTTNLDITADARKNSVGFLGRAHPLVRRSLDRVRNLSFGGTVQQGQDPRASAVKADVPVPTLLFTFLGRVNSRAGRELERVLAVKVDAEGVTEFYQSAEVWLTLADRKRAIRTTDVWQNYFASWGDIARQQAQQLAQTGFDPLAEAFIKEWQRELQAEQFRQEEWLKTRTQEIAPAADTGPQQLELFSLAAPANEQSFTPTTWASYTDPVEKLAAFATDKTQPARLRSEADGVLRIYRQRLGQLQARLLLGDPEIIPIGLLMLLPEVGRGA